MLKLPKRNIRVHKHTLYGPSDPFVYNGSSQVNWSVDDELEDSIRDPTGDGSSHNVIPLTTVERTPSPTVYQIIIKLIL